MVENLEKNGSEWRKEISKLFKNATRRNMLKRKNIIILTLEDLDALVSIIEKYIPP